MTVAEKRKKFMKTLCDVMDILDPSGANAKKYKAMYGKLSDKEFDTQIRSFFNNDKANFYFEYIDFDKELELENVEKAAEYLKVPLEEHVAIPYLNSGDTSNIPVTPTPVPVGWIHEKRMQQTLLKKNSGSTSIRKRNPKTGQVTGDDKNARNSDVETYSLIAIGAEKALAEFMGPRADDVTMEIEMHSAIDRNGSVRLEELTNDPKNKVALNTLNIYFLLMGFTTNLVTSLDTLIPENIKFK